ncbi:MAG TPA: RNA 2',3'-cyclic phosphodiesterase [Bacteroidales bacterium]|jgi:2'-5' RNA ligase|nr:RNA 2',3'-cyclic phosphodiesterase [Bacteroidales bacterium]
MMKRTFIAVKIETTTEMERLVVNLRSLLGNENIKWADIRNIHVTLAFMGDTPVVKIAPITQLIKGKCAGFGKFDFMLAGTGIFRNFRDPRIIWAGIKPQDGLIKLRALITECLEAGDVGFDGKPFVPHLTLGRLKNIKDIENLRRVLEKYRNIEFQKVWINEVVLFESILKPAGPVYIPLATLPLS